MDRLLRSAWRMRAELLRARRGLAEPPVLAAAAADPASLFNSAGLAPDPWQAYLLRAAPERLLLLACRQAGKTLTAAALTLWTACCRPGSLCLILSPTLRQSGEFFRDKVLPLYHALGRPVPPAGRPSHPAALTPSAPTYTAPRA
jgi:hypothetical protein